MVIGTFMVGDKVKVRLSGGVLIKGEVVSKGIDTKGSSIKYRYGVEFEHTKQIEYYYDYDLVPAHRFIYLSSCTCGAQKTYEPNLPPGHGFNCQLEINSRILGESK